MLHWWLIPALGVLSAGVIAFFLAILRTGGNGIRTDGRMVLDKPVGEEDSPEI